MTPIFELDTDAYLADTIHLTTAEHGAYVLILLAMWRSVDGYIDGSDKSMAKLVHLTSDKWRRIMGTIRPLLQANGSKVTQKRIQRDKQKESKYVESQITGFGKKPEQEQSSDSTPLLFDSELDIQLRKERTDSKLGKAETGKGTRRDSQRRRAPRAIIRDDWQLNERDTLYAQTLHFDSKKTATLRNAFVNYHRSRGTMIADLSATWRTWCDNEVIFAQRRNGNGNGSGRQFQNDSLSVSRAAEKLSGNVTSFPPRPRLVPKESAPDMRLLPKG